jgi:hypothetical protein
MSLYRGYFVPDGTDPTGLLVLQKPDPRGTNVNLHGWGGCYKKSELKKLLHSSGRLYTDFHDTWWYLDARRHVDSWNLLRKGCVGVTGCFLGKEPYEHMKTIFKDCYLALAQAQAQQKKLNDDGACKGCNTLGKPASAKIFGYFASQTYPDGTTLQYLPDKNDRICFTRSTGDTIPHPLTFGQDWGYYDDELDGFWHAWFSEGTVVPKHGFLAPVLISTPKDFVAFAGKKVPIYCVTCEGDKHGQLRPPTFSPPTTALGGY